MLKHNILSRAISCGNLGLQGTSPAVTWCVDYERKISIIGIVFNFLNDGHAGARLLMQDYWLDAKMFQVSCDRLLR